MGKRYKAGKFCFFLEIGKVNLEKKKYDQEVVLLCTENDSYARIRSLSSLGRNDV